jgi:hypothetical protein
MQPAQVNRNQVAAQAQLLNQDLEMSSDSSSTSSSSSSSFVLSAYVNRPLVAPPLSVSSSENPSRVEPVAAATQRSVHSNGSGMSRLLVKQAAKIPKIFTSRLSCQLAMGLDRAKAKQICAEFNPTFESRSFKLKCPTLDESFAMRFKEAKDQAAESVEKQLTSIQFKVMDIALPLLELKGRCIAEGLPRMESTIDSALDLWSAAFNHVTQHRRKNVLKVTDNQLRILANNPAHFSGKETEYLFGKKFVDVMVNQASQTNKLRQANRMAGPTRGRRGRRPYAHPYQCLRFSFESQIK